MNKPQTYDELKITCTISYSGSPFLTLFLAITIYLFRGILQCEQGIAISVFVNTQLVGYPSISHVQCAGDVAIRCYILEVVNEMVRWQCVWYWAYDCPA